MPSAPVRTATVMNGLMEYCRAQDKPQLHHCAQASMLGAVTPWSDRKTRAAAPTSFETHDTVTVQPLVARETSGQQIGSSLITEVDAAAVLIRDALSSAFSLLAAVASPMASAIVARGEPAVSQVLSCSAAA